jgi:hypothetical protein
MFNFFKKSPKLGGYIVLYHLEDWWYSTFTSDEQKHIVKTFQPLGASKDVLITGDFLKVDDNRTLSFLSSLAGWFNNPRDRGLAYKIIQKAEEYVDVEKHILDIHFFYQSKIEIFYRDREDPNKLKEATDACLKQIAISNTAAAAFKNAYNDSVLPMHVGFKQLCIILEKQKKYEEVVKFSLKAKEQGWGGDWDRRIEKCKDKK